MHLGQNQTAEKKMKWTANFILRSDVRMPSVFTGGETIKGISQQSGARIELQRNPPPNSDPNIKMFTVRGSPQQIDYARQLVEEKIGVNKDHLTLFWWIPPAFTVTYYLLPMRTIRDLSLPWVAHTVPLDHMEAQGHMAPQDHQVPQEPLWGHTTLDHTTRDPQDHSKYNDTLVTPTLGYWSRGLAVVHYFIYFISPYQRTSRAVPATRLGQRLPTLATGTTWPEWVYARLKLNLLGFKSV